MECAYAQRLSYQTNGLKRKVIEGMAYKNKAECEKEFVQYILSVGGVKCGGKMYERGNYYWFFDLANGERRYWTNLSEENQKLLGFKVN
jgi:hypothetical protein